MGRNSPRGSVCVRAGCVDRVWVSGCVQVRGYYGRQCPLWGCWCLRGGFVSTVVLELVVIVVVEEVVARVVGVVVSVDVGVVVVVS